MTVETGEGTVHLHCATSEERTPPTDHRSSALARRGDRKQTPVSPRGTSGIPALAREQPGGLGRGIQVFGRPDWRDWPAAGEGAALASAMVHGTGKLHALRRTALVSVRLAQDPTDQQWVVHLEWYGHREAAVTGRTATREEALNRIPALLLELIEQIEHATRPERRPGEIGSPKPASRATRVEWTPSEGP